MGEVIFDGDQTLLGLEDPDLHDAVLEGVVMQGVRFDESISLEQT